MGKIERRTCGLAVASMRCAVYAWLLMAVAMISGILGLRLFDFFWGSWVMIAAMILLLAAIILGIISLIRISLNRITLKGRIRAVVGIVLPLLTAICTPTSCPTHNYQRVKMAATVGDLKSIKIAAQAYRKDTGSWPDDGSSDSEFIKNNGIKDWDGPYLEKWPVKAMWGGNYIFHNDDKFGWNDIGQRGKVIYVEVTSVPIEIARQIDKRQDGETNFDKGSIRYRNDSLYFLIDVSK